LLLSQFAAAADDDNDDNEVVLDVVALLESISISDIFRKNDGGVGFIGWMADGVWIRCEPDSSRSQKDAVENHLQE